MAGIKWPPHDYREFGARSETTPRPDVRRRSRRQSLRSACASAQSGRPSAQTAYQNGGWIRSRPWSSRLPRRLELTVTRASVRSTLSRKVTSQAPSRPLPNQPPRQASPAPGAKAGAGVSHHHRAIKSVTPLYAAPDRPVPGRSAPPAQVTEQAASKPCAASFYTGRPVSSEARPHNRRAADGPPERSARRPRGPPSPAAPHRAHTLASRPLIRGGCAASLSSTSGRPCRAGVRGC